MSNTLETDITRWRITAQAKATHLGLEAAHTYLDKFADGALYQISGCSPGTMRSAMKSAILHGHQG